MRARRVAGKEKRGGKKPRVHIILIPPKNVLIQSSLYFYVAKGDRKRAIAGSAVGGARGPRGDNGI